MADSIETGIIIAATLTVAKRAEAFLAAASGHPGEDIGTILGNIANRRLKNAETVSGGSHLILLNLGNHRAECGSFPASVSCSVHPRLTSG